MTTPTDEEKALPKLGHDFSDGAVTCHRGCGAYREIDPERPCIPLSERTEPWQQCPDDDGVTTAERQARYVARLLSALDPATRERLLSTFESSRVDDYELSAEGDDARNGRMSGEPPEFTAAVEAVQIAWGRKISGPEHFAMVAAFQSGRSSAARELAERDERIRVLTEKVKAWEPTMRACASWRGRLPKICSEVTADLTPVVVRLADAYDAIPANLRPGEKA